MSPIQIGSEFVSWPKRASKQAPHQEQLEVLRLLAQMPQQGVLEGTKDKSQLHPERLVMTHQESTTNRR
jgi:hypothetical protein